MSDSLPAWGVVRAHIFELLKAIEQTDQNEKYSRVLREYIAVEDILMSPKLLVELYYRYSEIDFLPRGVAALGALHAYYVSSEHPILEAFYENPPVPRVPFDESAYARLPAWIAQEILSATMGVISGRVDHLQEALKLPLQASGVGSRRAAFEMLERPVRDLSTLENVLVQRMESAQRGKPVSNAQAIEALATWVSERAEDNQATGYGPRSIAEAIRRVRRAMPHKGIEPVREKRATKT